MTMTPDQEERVREELVLIIAHAEANTRSPSPRVSAWKAVSESAQSALTALDGEAPWQHWLAEASGTGWVIWTLTNGRLDHVIARGLDEPIARQIVADHNRVQKLKLAAWPGAQLRVTQLREDAPRVEYHTPSGLTAAIAERCCPAAMDVFNQLARDIAELRAALNDESKP